MVVAVAEAEAGLPLVRGESTELEQVFINLVLNAMDATPKGGTISLRTTRSGDNVVVRVTDSGSGIEPRNLQKIFDPFFTTKDVGVGTGLGLSITYRIIEEHGGSIHVESTPGEGTTFIVTLPNEQTHRA